MSWAGARVGSGAGGLSSLSWKVGHGANDGGVNRRENVAGGEGEEWGVGGMVRDEKSAEGQGGEEEDGVGRYALTADRLAALPVVNLCVCVHYVSLCLPLFSLCLSTCPPTGPPWHCMKRYLSIYLSRTHTKMRADMCLQICPSSISSNRVAGGPAH